MSAEAILEQDPDERRRAIVECFSAAFGDLLRAEPGAMRGKFRKMAAGPFAFYRGSACLFYADVADDDDPWLVGETARIWIHGDLHAENFGTYMNSAGRLVFDVNDFDEAYVGPFTWDLKRLVASLALLGYAKALSDEDIDRMVDAYVSGYLDQVRRFAAHEGHEFALTLDTATGPVLDVLHDARMRTRVALLDSLTTVEDRARRFVHGGGLTPLDDTARAEVMRAFEDYLDTIPPAKRLEGASYRVKDVAARRGVGIGSAGLPSYNLLLEGATDALENDVLIFMKQAQSAAPSPFVDVPDVAARFRHDGHRTVLSQRALQAHSDPWLGHTTLREAGQLVAEVSPYATDLRWDELNELPELLEVLDLLGRATAKIHCVGDVEAEESILDICVEEAIMAAVEGREDQFAADMRRFAAGYGEVARRDHQLFLDAFRNREISGV